MPREPEKPPVEGPEMQAIIKAYDRNVAEPMRRTGKRISGAIGDFVSGRYAERKEKRSRRAPRNMVGRRG